MYVGKAISIVLFADLLVNDFVLTFVRHVTHNLFILFLKRVYFFL